MAVFLFPSVGWRPFWILLILRYFPWTDFLGLFFTHYRGINEVISIEKPFPSIFLNLFTLFTRRLVELDDGIQWLICTKDADLAWVEKFRTLYSEIHWTLHWWCSCKENDIECIKCTSFSKSIFNMCKRVWTTIMV